MKDSRVEVIQGDITKQQVNAVVNAANSSLLGGGGVDGAIHRAGGKAILEECIKIRDRQGGCNTGEAVITTGGNLPAKYVIHAVGPVWSNNSADKAATLLANAYRNSLKLAVKNGVKTIAFPNISTGIYHFPKPQAADIAIKTITDFLTENNTITKVLFVCFDDDNYGLYQQRLGGS
ncbi:O-acetyl-ADP-ribose deacetylase [Mucilaginibacter roseus]|uniref:O-acetyl-ADP-ribose deacetylase n=1 Tax=Mucilaginibacter roseus TaxID=1528868 RepID=A0ABS8U4E5_9SPHI|nr:O-acetyl-ADP-ribose deacetylase [Mucilaginibacter roseus]MCD8741517.1 O-acetyl-ADP-ribose deacetylase [Mucilaginibacter roseus]